jgi:hypothetical protein
MTALGKEANGFESAMILIWSGDEQASMDSEGFDGFFECSGGLIV